MKNKKEVTNLSYTIVQGFGYDTTETFKYENIERFIKEIKHENNTKDYFEDHWWEFYQLWTDRLFLKNSLPYFEEAFDGPYHDIKLYITNAVPYDDIKAQTALIIPNPSIGTPYAVFMDYDVALNRITQALSSLTDYRYAPHNATMPDIDELTEYIKWYNKTYKYDPRDHTVFIN